MGANKRRLHRLEAAIRPPTALELNDDERAVLLTLNFQRRVLPSWLRDAETWQAAGRPTASAADKQAAAETWNRVERLIPALLTANTRTNELIAQGRVEAIVKRLAAWGLWREPDPPPPTPPTILERLERVFADETNRNPASQAGNSAA